MCRYLALYFCYDTKPGDIKLLNPEIFVNTIIDCLTSDDQKLNKLALKAIDIVVEVAQRVNSSLDKLCQSEFGKIGKKLCHACYQQDWRFRAGGCRGISHICTKMPQSWLLLHQIQFVQAILFVLRVSVEDTNLLDI